jgi:trimethylamine:corrinoid methyltransferase-like protein
LKTSIFLSAKVSSWQAGYEKAMTALIVTFAGPDIIRINGWLENLLSDSLAQAVIMDEVFKEVLVEQPLKVSSFL